MTFSSYNDIIHLYMINQHESALTAAYRLLETPLTENQTGQDASPSAERAAFLLLVGSICHQSGLMNSAQDFYRGALRLLESTPSCDTALYARFNLASVVAPRDLREAQALHCQIDASAPGASDALFQHGLHLQRQRLFAK